MENALHRFVRLLRLRQVRISIPEALDAMACAGQPGMLADKAHLKAALRVALIKDRRDEEVFDDVFDPEDLAQQYNLHQEANKIDLAAMTEEIVLSKDNQGVQGDGNRVQIQTDRLSNAG